MDKTILLGITTTPGADWREMIADTHKFGINEVALFPTYLEPDQREEFYKLLENSPIVSAPHIHLRDDFTLDEVDYLIGKYHPVALNLHSDETSERALERLSKYKDVIYIENQFMEDQAKFEAMLQKSAGLCPDFSHLEDRHVIRKMAGYSNFEQLLSNYKIGCCHISSIRSTPREANEYSYHSFSSLKEFDYVIKYLDYFPDYISLELENSFSEQLKAKEYIESLILKN